MKRSNLILPLVVAALTAFSAEPADAQGNGRGREARDDRREQPRFERRDRDDRDDDRRWEDRRDRDRRGDARRVPPGWCIGRGNPHNTPANCGYRDSRGRNARYDTRYERRGGSYGSYDEAHRQFHREHDAWCAARRRERPLDLRWQAQVRAECRDAHERFHREWGRGH